MSSPTISKESSTRSPLKRNSRTLTKRMSDRIRLKNIQGGYSVFALLTQSQRRQLYVVYVSVILIFLSTAFLFQEIIQNNGLVILSVACLVILLVVTGGLIKFFHQPPIQVSPMPTQYFLGVEIASSTHKPKQLEQVLIWPTPPDTVIVKGPELSKGTPEILT
ncbi:hypothetical protein K7432_002139 [Basidiobolus ranarum]|uniref:Uncharacterized protein n=1 Tax=Basidiobolus ranarum TaxID=34480 RepID=A0ABR2W893_9FUNG